MKNNRKSYLGKKFKHKDFETVYTIGVAENPKEVNVAWRDVESTDNCTYPLKTLIKCLKDGTWILISEDNVDMPELVHPVVGSESIRTFGTGANRNSDEGKLDFEGFLSPMVLKKYAEYMHKNRYLDNGDIRDSDNWQKGIPVPAYMKSMYRHFFDTWSNYRGHETPESQVQNLCGLLFNTMGMLHEILKEESK